jgi:hypothetical protein
MSRRDTHYWLVIWSLSAILVACFVGLILIVIKTSGYDRDLAEKHLGPDAVCGTESRHTLRCTRGGQAFLCTVNGDRVGCAEGAFPTAEGK